MAVEERRRVELFERLAAAIGEEAATTMLDLLPPPGRDVATSDDIARLEQRIDVLEAHMNERFGMVDERFGRVDERFGTFERHIDERFTMMSDRLDARLIAMQEHLSVEFERRINDAITAQTRTVVFALLSVLVVLAGYALSLARFAG